MLKLFKMKIFLLCVSQFIKTDSGTGTEPGRIERAVVSSDHKNESLVSLPKCYY